MSSVESCLGNHERNKGSGSRLLLLAVTMANSSCLLGASRSLQLSAGAVP